MLNHPLFISLKKLRGNARGAVLTEPLWGIPYNLYAPYVSIYMLALGLTDVQIGIITSISLVGQIISSMFSGIITDKLGRKLTTFIFDAISWSVPCLIWAVAQNFNYFVVAAMVNSVWRITHNSWTCVLVEDTDPDLLVDIYSWIYIAGLLVAFVAPLAGLLINTFTLIPTMRGLYILAFVMMTAKFIIMNAMVTETKQGKLRMAETKHQSILTMLGEYRDVFRQILGTPQTLYTLGIMVVMSIALMINNTFWSILATEKIHIPPQHLALYPFARAVFMLIFFFIAMHRISAMHFKKPMLFGFAGFVLAQVVLICVPEKSYILLLVNVLIEACSYAVLGTQLDRMVVVSIDPKERARIMAIIFVIMISITSPFGWIAGILSQTNRLLPFILNIVLFLIGAFLTYRASKLVKDEI
jgi:MFS family permease